MKKYFLFILIILSSLSGFVACSDDDKTDDFLRIIEDEVRFPAYGAETYLDIYSSSQTPVVEVSDSWIEAWIEGDKVMLKVPSFFSGISRTSSINIRSGAFVKKVTIFQSPYTLNVSGSKEIAISVVKGGDYKVKLDNTFPEDLSKFHIRLKDESDKSWITASFVEATEVALKVTSNPTNKPKKATVYFIVDGEVESTIMDSLTINSVFIDKEDFLNTQWIATYRNRNNDVFNEEVKILENSNGQLVLNGISLYEKTIAPFDIPVQLSSGNIVIPTTRQYVYKESDNRYIYFSVLTSDGLMWGVGSGPQNYTGTSGYDYDNNKRTIEFNPFQYSGYTMSGIGFRVYTSSTPTTNLGMARYIFDIKLVEKK